MRMAMRTVPAALVSVNCTQAIRAGKVTSGHGRTGSAPGRVVQVDVRWMIGLMLGSVSAAVTIAVAVDRLRT